MKIALCGCDGGFCSGWVNACNANGYKYVEVNPYDSNLMEFLRRQDVTHFLWHWHHSSPKDWLFARQLLISLEAAGIKVFPDINTCWHFDDKLGQKYLLEALGLPLARTWVFYSKEEAIEWAKRTTWPKVFKLRAGAGSKNVQLIRSYRQARKIIGVMFGVGIPSANVVAQLSGTAKLVSSSPFEALKKINRVPQYLKGIMQRKSLPVQKGYCMFQDFIAGNTCDTRIVVIGERAFGMQRKVRENDFRASGSGLIEYDKELIPCDCIQIAFDAAEKIKSQSLALDFVKDKDGTYYIVEISYGYSVRAYYNCQGYWDRKLRWHSDKVTPEQWIINDLLTK